MKIHQAVRRRSGFSLIELLTVLMIIGLLAAIVVPNMGFLSDETAQVKYKRNAQNIMLAYTTGVAAGVSWPEGDAATQVAAVLAGKKPPNGMFATTMFQSTVTADSVAGSYPFIGVLPDGELFYDSTGKQSPTGH